MAISHATDDAAARHLCDFRYEVCWTIAARHADVCRRYLHAIVELYRRERRLFPTLGAGVSRAYLLRDTTGELCCGLIGGVHPDRIGNFEKLFFTVSRM